MSITYSGDVANTKLWTPFIILLNWKGSMYRKLWLEALIFLFIYESVSITFHYILTADTYPKSNQFIKNVISQFRDAYKTVPLTFVLGFYVTMVVNQWFNQYTAIPWTDDIALLTTTFIRGNTFRAVQLRRTIMRYVNTAYLLAARKLFIDFKAQFPSEEHIVKSGFLNEDELKRLMAVESTLDTYFVPVSWTLNLIYEAYKENLISTDRLLDSLIDRVASFRGEIGALYLIDQINPPLAYSQVAGLAVYGYLFGAMIGLQKVDDDDVATQGLFVSTFPAFETLIIVFYIGWYKIAENLLNPYGNTEYNFDVIYSLQRNLQVSYLIVDQLHDWYPPILEEAVPVNFERNDTDVDEQSLPFSSMTRINEIDDPDYVMPGI